jgi:poly-beta-1,6-N-acetyl-D-glucosamine synthase
MTLLLWCSVAFIAYTYLGYPLLAALLARLRPDYHGNTDSLSDADCPSVCVIIAAHNEEGRVAAKIANLGELDYPRDRLEVLLVSDGSTDATVERAREAGVRVIAFADRRGKPRALNAGVSATAAEVIVFTDVRQRLVPDALRDLIATLRRPGIGVVSGELVHTRPGSMQAARIGLYWRYEKSIRKAESRWSSTVGTTGALYAIRRIDFVPLPEDTILDDFEIPMAVVRRGGRAVIDTRAVMYDELQLETAGERQRKIRTLTGNFQSFARNPWLFSPLENPVWFQFLSHKVFRLLVPYALVSALVSSLASHDPYFRSFGLVQLACYGLAFASRPFRALRERPLVSFISVFVELNVAAVVALCRFSMGRSSARWERT